MASTLLKNAIIVNEGESFRGSLFIKDSIISRVIKGNDAIEADSIIDCTGKYIFPGIIDDQVHFREPGAPSKGSILSESKAAVLGGVTSFMDMPNNNPPATTKIILENKYKIASENSYANYSFYIGADNDNIEELIKTNFNKVCGVKVFMGSSTGNMLVDKQESLEKIFSGVKQLVATHCEDENTIKVNLENAKRKYGDDIPFSNHPLIRSREACIKSTSKAIELAKTFNTHLHILHISTADEVKMIADAKKEGIPVTAETCVHYLYFTDNDYDKYQGKIKCNPSIKKESDRMALIDALCNGIIDMVATDHAPHTIEEKSKKYLECPSGLPLIQHSFQLMVELYKDGYFSLEQIAEFMSHSPSRVFKIEKRGVIREGFYADLLIANLDTLYKVSKENIAYHCGWSPLEGFTFSSSIEYTFVNGEAVVVQGEVKGLKSGNRLNFKYE